MTSSKMLEGHCADVEHLLREGSMREAVRLAVALPDICSAFESPEMQSSHDDYVRWCVTWLRKATGERKSVTGERLFRLYTRALRKERAADGGPVPAPALRRLRMRRGARTYRSLGRSRVWEPHNGLEAFQVTLCEALLDATRSWYREHGHDQVVQKNIGKLLMTR